MAKVYIRQSIAGRFFSFWCPGCDGPHTLNPTWKFNEDVVRPTFFPSVLSTGMIRCHSYVTDGRIEFLGDTEHALAGQTVDLPDYPEAYM